MKNLYPLCIVALLPLCSISFAQDQDKEPRACRSVHLHFEAKEGTAFYNEMTVTESAPGTYFAACGFSKGYFGIQELHNGKKIVIFSVWEPGKQDNPDATPEDRRVIAVDSGSGVRVKRFGGEGTGGQSFYDYEWKIGQAVRFVVYAKRDGDRTVYAGYFYVEHENRWQHMATFSTLADGQLLRGRYSFVEDFLRNGESARKERSAIIGNGWTRIDDEWQPLLKARFTADQTQTNNVDAGLKRERFFLATGGATENKHEKLWSNFAQPEAERKPPIDLPNPFGDGSSAVKRFRVLSYNIKHGRGNDGKVDLERTAEVIRRLNPDVVALQEVDNVAERSGKIDEAKKLAELTGLSYHEFGSFFDFQGGKYGMAMLSRYPIRKAENVRLPEGTEPRSSLIAEIKIGKTKSVTIANVHFYQTEEQRTAQANALLKHLDGIEGDALVVGDFNSTPDSKVMKLFEPKFQSVDKGDDHFTFPSDKPSIEIDFGLVRTHETCASIAADVIDEPLVSDHRPLSIDFMFLPIKATQRESEKLESKE